MPFVPGIHPPKDNTADPYMFLFREEDLLVTITSDTMRVPRESDVAGLGLRIEEKTFFGMLDSVCCYCGTCEAEGGSLAEGNPFAFSALRPLLGTFSDALFMTAGVASQIVRWQGTHRYCGRCGSGTVKKGGESAVVCPDCGLVRYSRISPAIIVAVTRNEKILLARANRFRAKLYSVLAGFVEPGENLEECLRREVLEEVGITVTDIHYFGSQPWPFPDSLMIAFTARYEGGEIVPDPAEIVDAGWFEKDGLPEIPPHGTIARRLIDWFVEKGG
jgi:NAD+ diphosphatase